MILTFLHSLLNTRESILPSPNIKHSQRSSGFTIVELLIVIVVIGILAAITIIAFNGVQEKARTSSVQSDLRNAAQKTELSKIDSQTNLYAQNTSDIASLGLSFTKKSYAALIYCHKTDGSGWALAAETLDGKKYYVNSSTSTPTTLTEVIQNGTGNSVCPAAGLSGAGWQWLLQNKNASWWSGVK